MWLVAIAVLVVALAVILSCVLIKRHNEKLLNDALSKSPRISVIEDINQKYSFKIFKNEFEYVVHFTDLDEFKASDLKLIKYSFLVKNRSKIRESLFSLNYNIELYKKYSAEINSAKSIDDSEFLSNYKINHTRYHEIEANHISPLLAKPILKCFFVIYYDYSSSTGRSTRESEHFKVCVDKIVDVDAFLAETFPKTSLEEYNFKPHYLNKHLYVHYNLVVSEETENRIKKEKNEKERMLKECEDFYGMSCWPNSVETLIQNREDYYKTRQILCDFLEQKGLRYKIVEANKFEYFIIIENTVYLYVGLTSEGAPMPIVAYKLSYAPTYVVELNYNPFFDYKNKVKTEHVIFWYHKYLSFSSYTPLEMAIKRSKIFLRVDIEKINNDWEGKPSVCIVYEINLLGEYAYAIMISEDVDNCITIGNKNCLALLNYESTKKEKEKNIYISDYDDTTMYSLSADNNFVLLFKNIKKIVRSKLKKEEVFKDKILEHVTYYILPINIKNKERSSIKTLKTDIFRKINHEYLSIFDSYKYVNGHQKWKNEYLLYQLCKKIYGSQVVYQYRPPFLKSEKGQLSYDIYLSKLRIAIEYQGKQHFEPIDFFGGKETFEDLRKRDLLKKTLSKENDVKLVEITYKEPITSELVKKKIEEAKE